MEMPPNVRISDSIGLHVRNQLHAIIDRSNLVAAIPDGIDTATYYENLEQLEVVYYGTRSSRSLSGSKMIGLHPKDLTSQLKWETLKTASTKYPSQWREGAVGATSDYVILVGELLTTWHPPRLKWR